jgi:hypothetical protein
MSHLTYKWNGIVIDDFKVGKGVVSLIYESAFFHIFGDGICSSPLLYSPTYYGLYDEELEQPKPFERNIWATHSVSQKWKWKLFVKEDEIWGLSPNGEEFRISESPTEIVAYYIIYECMPVHAPPWRRRALT